MSRYGVFFWDFALKFQTLFMCEKYVVNRVDGYAVFSCSDGSNNRIVIRPSPPSICNTWSFSKTSFPMVVSPTLEEAKNISSKVV